MNRRCITRDETEQFFLSISALNADVDAVPAGQSRAGPPASPGRAEAWTRTCTQSCEHTTAGGLRFTATDMGSGARRRVLLCMRVSAASSSGTGDAQGVTQVVTRADVKLAVGVSEMGLDGLGGDEQRLGNLGIAEALGGELGDPALRGGEGVSAAMGRAPRPGASAQAMGGRTSAARCRC
jgi:hypothetical protein